jgi:hypothetical protein
MQMTLQRQAHACMVMGTGDRVLVERTTNALRNLGARVPSQPAPGILGSRTVPTARQLGQAPKPQFGPGAGTPTPPAGSRPVNTLTPQPFQGPRPRGGALARTAQDSVPSPAARTQFTEDLISQPVAQGAARPPVQGPSMTGNPVQGQLDLRFGPGARAAADFTTSKGAVRPAGTNIAGQPYRGGPVATAENIEQIRGSLAPRMQVRALSEEVSNKVAPGQGSFFLDNAPDIWTDAFRMRPELIRQLPREVQQRIGTTMMREAADLGPVAPRAAFGPGAGPAPVDPVASAAFARNAASGAELVDLGALFNNPAFRAATGAAGLGLFGAGVAGMMPGDRTGETTAGAPPSLPPTLFTETDGSPLGAVAPGVVAPPTATGNIDPSVAAPTVTGGNLQQESATREALAQYAPGAAAVRRAVEPMSPERYRSIEEYAAARQAYGQAEPEIQELMKYMEGQSPSIGGGLAMWASSNPVLAYRFQERQLANPAANQQSAESITTTTVTSPIGSQIDAAAVGNAQATADAAVNPSQGAFDMVGATAPQVQPNLQRVKEFIQRQAPRAAMYAGY